MKVMLSIKPEFVKEIVEGNKQFEYRKSIFKKTNIESVVIYATKPYGKVVGEFLIDDILERKPSELWDLTSEFSGISQTFFEEYFEGRDIGYAIKIKKFIPYDEPLDLSFFEQIKSAPQSFCYL
ncbi:ASCH domain-containing protein [Listeria sp. FSL L7-1582]|uniref:ASCH domain-containing protein n=1 Tax=Listeria portnoyi TaxID=2713504 RepID=UPI00164DB7B3|nr:ASCH domain-containing protein [Listeria portnoyi]MBC6310844.1 ASCH domain-containing protein [Listeria portnoyi]